MKQTKLKKFLSLILVLSLTFTVTTGSVFAKDSNGNKDFSETKCTITKIMVLGTGELQVLFELENNQTAKGYEVYRSTSRNGKYSLVSTVPYNSYYDENVKKGKIYYYKVRGYKYSKGKKIYSKFSKITSKRVTTGPIYVQNLKVSKSGKVTGTILKNKNADGYYIYYATADNGPYKLVKQLGKSDLKLNFKVPTDSEFYYFKVIGYVKVNGKKYKGTCFGPYDALIDARKVIKISNKELKEALGLSGTVYKEDLIWITDIDLYGVDCKDEDFAFLKYCMNLEKILIESCSLMKIDTLCKNLKDRNVKLFSLRDTPVADLSPLKDLTQLEELYLSDVPTWDISVIEHLPELKQFGYDMYSDDPSEGKSPYRITHYKDLEDICKKANLNEYDLGYGTDTWIELEDYMDDFIRREITPGMSDYDKIKKAHDFICKTVTYGYDSPQNCKYLSPYCAMVEGHGVCHDYTMAFGYLTARMGFETYYVYGYKKEVGVVTEGKDHAWNIIKLGNNYYHIDCTWDDPTGGNNIPQYKYFLKSDDTLKSLRNYKWKTKFVCPSDY